MKALHEALKRKREAGELVYLNPLEKSREKPTSKVLAIKAKCWQCQGEDADPCWKWRVGNCEIPDCGTFLHRPYQNLAGSPIPAALRSFSGEKANKKKQ